LVELVVSGALLDGSRFSAVDWIKLVSPDSDAGNTANAPDPETVPPAAPQPDRTATHGEHALTDGLSQKEPPAPVPAAWPASRSGNVEAPRGAAVAETN
jgi:hypothetical protein